MFIHKDMEEFTDFGPNYHVCLRYDVNAQSNKQHVYSSLTRLAVVFIPCCLFVEELFLTSTLNCKDTAENLRIYISIKLLTRSRIVDPSLRSQFDWHCLTDT